MRADSTLARLELTLGGEQLSEHGADKLGRLAERRLCAEALDE